MGGTSTDVAHFAGEYERAFDTEVAGVRLRAPMMQIHTVAAGGGSICQFDGVRLRVGPESAGADPGPASYRRGGPLTVTDCNVLLGRIQPEFFPAVFGAAGDQPLDAAVVAEQFRVLAAEIERATGVPQTPQGVAAGCVRIAVENMANAIKKISVQRGHDVTEYTLVLLRRRGRAARVSGRRCARDETVFIHPLAGVLSAYGIGLADVTVMKQQAVEAVLDDRALTDLATPFATLEPRRASVARAGRAGCRYHDRAQSCTQVRRHGQHAGAADRDSDAATLTRDVPGSVSACAMAS